MERSTYEVLLQEALLPDVVVPTAVPGVECAPASVDLAGAELELVTALAREHRLREALATGTERFDVVLIDCPPSLGLLTINAMVAARDLIVPVQCEYYALEGLGQLLGNAERVRRSLNPELRIAGILLTMFDARTNLSPEVAEDVRAHFGEVVYETVIPRSIRLSEAPSFGQPAVTLDPASRGARSYLALADEIATNQRPVEHGQGATPSGGDANVGPEAAGPHREMPRSGKAEPQREEMSSARARDPAAREQIAAAELDAQMSVGAAAHPREGMISTMEPAGASSPSREGTSGAAGGAPQDSEAAEDDGDATPARRAAAPGPGGRGYGVVTPVPPGIDEAWPPPEPWTGSS
jgi:chromosome partitioning protein